MPLPPPLANAKVTHTLTTYVTDIERAFDLTMLELHYSRAGAYLSALKDVDAFPAAEIAGLLLFFDRLYQAQFQHLGRSNML